MRKPLTYKLGGPEMFAAEFDRLNAEIDRLTAEVVAIAMNRTLANELAQAKIHITELTDAYREEVRQFNLGHDAFFAGEPSDNAPKFEIDYDVWTCGWAWGKFVKEEAAKRQDEP